MSLWTMVGAALLVAGGYALGERRFRRRLRRSEAEAFLSQEGAGMGVWDWDVPSGRVNYGRRCAEILGYRPEEVDQSFEFFRTLLHPEDAETVLLSIQANLEGRSEFHEAEMRLRMRSGAWRWVSVRGRVIERGPDGQARRMTGVMYKLDSSRITAPVLNQSRETYAQLFAHMGAGAAIYRAVDDGADFVFTDINPAGECFSQVHREEIVGRRVTEVFPSVEEMGLLAVLRRVWRTGEPGHLPVTLYRDQRMEQWVENHVLRLPDGQVVAMYDDVSERKRTELALRESEECFRTIVDSMPVLLDAFDENGRIIRWNRECERVTGYAATEIVGHPEALELLYPDPEYRAEMLRLVREQPEVFRDLEFTLTTKDGQPRTIAWSNVSRESPIKGWATWSVGMDVTERREMESRLRQAEKMQAIGQLAGGVAHDFNNQLGGIMGYAEVIHGKVTDPRLRTFAQGIIESAERASALISQLLAFARKGQRRKARVDLHALIREVLEMLKYTIDRRIRLTSRLDAPSGELEGDPAQLQNALLNLALNARDAMPAGGELNFATERVQLDEAYCAGHPYEIQPGDYLCVSVTDTGSGIAPEVRAHLFEPFFTTKEVGKGTGMGLAAVYGTVKSHGGSISVYSEIGRGSTFRLYLPAAVAEASEAEPAEAEPILSGGRLLVVDDEDRMREITVEILAAAGFSVHACVNGREAVDYYRTHWAEVDLVVLDMVMPELSGPDAFRQLREINPAVRILIATGFSLSAETEGLLAQGACGFIQKPFRRELLLRKVAECLEPPAGGDPAAA